MIIRNFLKFFTYFIVIFYSSAALSNNSINYIDMGVLMNNSLAGKSIKKQLDVIKESNDKKFKKIQGELKKEEVELISKKNILSEVDYKKDVALFKKKISEYKISRNNTVNRISKMQSDAEKKLIKVLKTILAEYSKKNSIPYIISKQAVIIGETKFDITGAILKILDIKINEIKLT